MRLRARAAAVRTAVPTQVAQVDRLVLVGVPAVAAVLRVGGVLHAGESLGVVVHAEVGHAAALAAEVRHQRVVGVQHEASTAIELAHELRPAVGKQLELAVAVELVAEQVGEEEQAGLHVGRDGGQPRLVDLEEPKLAALPTGVEQRGGHSPGHVRAGAVVHQRPARALERGGDHRCRGGLPVGRRHQHRARLELARHALERARRELQQDPSGSGGAAATADAAAGGPCEPGEKAGEPEHQDGAMTRRQRRSTRMIAGVAPIGSPSA